MESTFERPRENRIVRKITRKKGKQIPQKIIGLVDIHEVFISEEEILIDTLHKAKPNNLYNSNVFIFGFIEFSWVSISI